MKQTKIKSLNLRKAVGAVAFAAMAFSITGTSLALTYSANQKIVGGDMTTSDWNFIDDALAGLQYLATTDGWGFNVAPSSGVGVTTDQIVVTGDGAQITGNSSVTGTFDVDGAATASTYVADSTIEATTTVTAGSGLIATTGGVTIGSILMSAVGTDAVTSGASLSGYYNTGSGLAATNVQTAIDEIVAAGVLPSGTDTHTIRYNGTAWIDAGTTLTNDGTDISMSGSLGVTGTVTTGALVIGSTDSGAAAFAALLGFDNTITPSLSSTTIQGAIDEVVADFALLTATNGAALVGVEDSALNFTGTNVETVLAELQGNIDTLGTNYIPYTGADTAIDFGSQTVVTTGTLGAGAITGTSFTDSTMTITGGAATGLTAVTTVALTATGTTTLDTALNGILIATAGVVSADGAPLDTTNGGTGLATYTTGDILYASAADTLSALAVGTDGEVLTLAAGVPSWGSSTATTVDLAPVTLGTCDAAATGEVKYAETGATGTNDLVGEFYGCVANGDGVTQTYAWVVMTIFAN